jgi:nucleoside-diphosphate-sugar epimerase
MRAFVTGGSGFVGKRLIAALRGKEHEVRALARSEAAQNEVRLAGAEPCPGDLADVEALKRGMEGCEVAFHSAAYVKPGGTRADFFEANVRGTENVLEAARAAGVKRLIHVSTEAVLVDGSPLINVDETRPLPEKPIGHYPSTKNAAERLVLSVNSPEFTTIAVRPRFIWGKGDNAVLPTIMKSVKAGQFRWVSGGHYKTSTCHVANCVEGLLLAAEKGRGGEAYFLTDGEPVDFRDFVTAMLKTQGVEPGKGTIPFGLAMVLATVADLLWNTFSLSGGPPLSRSDLLLVGREVTVSDAKARRELGYEGRVTREEGLREMEQAKS